MSLLKQFFVTEVEFKNTWNTYLSVNVSEVVRIIPKI